MWKYLVDKRFPSEVYLILTDVPWPPYSLCRKILLRNSKVICWQSITSLLWQWRITWRKLKLPHTYFNSPEDQESCDSLAKNNFVCDCVWKNTKASRNCPMIYLKSKHSCKHCIFHESWLYNKTEKVWHLFAYAFISLLLLMFFKIVFIFHRHVDPNVAIPGQKIKFF